MLKVMLCHLDMGSEGSTVIAAYRYDAFNRRIIKTVDQTTYRYTYDDWNIVEISTSANDYANIIDHGMDNHIAIEVFDGTNSEIYYFLTDERGNVVALTDEIGNIVERYRYLVYGEHIVLNELFVEKDCGIDTCYAGNLHNFLWGGSMHEPETDLYWMRNRYYHKGMKRFINQDPRGEVIHPDCSELFEFSRYFSTNDETNSGSLFVEEAGGKEPKSGQCNKSEDGLLCPTIWGDANNLGNGFAYVAGMVVEATDPTGLIGYTNRFSIDWGVFEKTVSEGPAEGIPNIMIHTDMVSALKDAGITIGKGLLSATVLYNEFTCPDTGTKMTKFNYFFNNFRGYYFEKNGYYYVEIVDKKTEDRTYVKINKETGEVEKSNKKEFEEKKREKEKEREEKKDENKKDENKKDDGWGSKKKNKKEEQPLDPYDYYDSVQLKLISNMLSSMLKLGEEKSIYEEGPVIEFESEGPSGNTQKIFIFNPFYRGKDPMEEIIWRIKTDSGMWGFVRNPFAPGGDYDLGTTTYEKIKYKGFVQPEVDPYWK